MGVGGYLKVGIAKPVRIVLPGPCLVAPASAPAIFVPRPRSLIAVLSVASPNLTPPYTVPLLIFVDGYPFPWPSSNGSPLASSKSLSRSVPLLLVSCAPFHSHCEDAHPPQTLRRPIFHPTSSDPDPISSNIRVLVFVLGLVLITVMVIVPVSYRIVPVWCYSVAFRSGIPKYYRVMM